jgi:hypothetical protein
MLQCALHRSIYSQNFLICTSLADAAAAAAASAMSEINHNVLDVAAAVVVNTQHHHLSHTVLTHLTTKSTQ